MLAASNFEFLISCTSLFFTNLLQYPNSYLNISTLPLTVIVHPVRTDHKKHPFLISLQSNIWGTKLAVLPQSETKSKGSSFVSLDSAVCISHGGVTATHEENF